jgi:hypothetical protein
MSLNFSSAASMAKPKTPPPGLGLPETGGGLGILNK